MSLFYSKGFIISHENTFEMIEISSVNGIVKSSPQLKDPEAIIHSFVVNAGKKLIYYIDSKNNVLKELDIKTQQIQTLTAISNGNSKYFFLIIMCEVTFDFFKHNNMIL